MMIGTADPTSQRAGDLQAVDPGQAEVKDDEIGTHALAPPAEPALRRPRR